MSTSKIDADFVEILSRIINSLDKINNVLIEVEKTNKINDVKSLGSIFDELFLSNLFNRHVHYKITLIGKSTQVFYWGERTEGNSNKHIKLDLVSDEIKYFDELYEGKFTDLLRFFKHLFSLIENLSINDNIEKALKYQKLLSIIKEDFIYLKYLQLQADYYTARKGQILKTLIFFSKNKRPDWQMYFNIIIANNIKFLYHFTDKSNLESIIESGGLYSLLYCEKNNIKIPMPGSNLFSRELDKQKNLDNYVRLSFCKNHPMQYIALKEGRIKNPIVLECSTEIIFHKNVLFSDRNANKKESIIDDSFSHFQSLKFDIFKKQYLEINTDREMASLYQAEVLIPQHLPIEYIQNLYNL